MYSHTALVPYFTFNDLIETGHLIVKVFTNQSSLMFGVKKKEILITFSDLWSSSLKLKLPVEVIEPEKVAEVCTYDENAECHILSLKRADPLQKGYFIKITNLDVISKYLTWDDDFQEEPDITTEEISRITEKFETIHLDAEKIVKRDELGTYGFASKYKHNLASFEGNWRKAIDLSNPDEISVVNRYHLRWEDERQSFDWEHYLADFFLDSDNSDEEVPALVDIILHKLYWQKIEKADDHKLTPDQMEILAQLPFKKYNLTKEERIEVMHSLFDIILAFAYDYRINRGRHNSESAWNVNKLSATLSWLQVHESVEEVAISFFRRSLTFPLHRYWLLSLRVLDDVIKIFEHGRRQILNCLISIYELFENDDDRCILNELYINDYLIWIQQVHPDTIKNYVESMKSCRLIKKEKVFSMLPQLEQVAVETLKNESDDCYTDADHRYNVWKTNLDDLTLRLVGEVVDVSSDDVAESSDR